MKKRKLEIKVKYIYSTIKTSILCSKL
jgi:hypothetical protein